MYIIEGDESFKMQMYVIEGDENADVYNRRR